MSDHDPILLQPHQEAMLREHLSAELDPQLGRAEDRFRQFLSDSTSRDVQRDPYRIGGRFRGWMFSVAGAAIAACLGFLAAGPTLHSRTQQTAGSSHDSTPVSLPWVQQTVDQQTIDGGTVVDDQGNPVRVLQRRKWETTRWFDDHKQLKAESVVPEDETVYVRMKTY